MVSAMASDAAAIIDAAVEDGLVPGVGLVVIDGGARVEILRGVASPAGDPLTANTVGHYFSSVKVVTSAVVMSLVDDGVLDLDAQLSTVLPEWASRRREHGIPTLRHLLTHTAGLTYPAVESGPDVHPVDAAYRDADITHHGYDTLVEFSAKLAEQPLCFEPGTRWRYSLAHDLVGRVIEEVAGESVDVVFAERIFEPLGMTSSGFVATPDMAERLGACWQHQPDEVPDLVLVDPGGERSAATDARRMRSCGGGLLSTLNDYVTFLVMLGNGGTVNGRRVLSESSVDAIMSDHLGDDMENDDPDTGFRVCTHTGFGFGGEVERTSSESTSSEGTSSGGTSSGETSSGETSSGETSSGSTAPSYDMSGRFSWGGYAGTSFFVDRRVNRVAALHIQVQNDFSIQLWQDLIPLLTA